MVRWRYLIAGSVQGVGFRPFVFGLAQRNHLAGFVQNSGSQAVVEVQGTQAALLSFDQELKNEKPAPAIFTQILRSEIPLLAVAKEFEILQSDSNSEIFEIPQDVTTCHACLSELRDSKNRRYQYPFIHCASCGPRWSVLESLPFDRERTSLRDFPLCKTCREEYSNPQDRRFHAQTMSCAECGPHLSFSSVPPSSRKALAGTSVQELMKEILQEVLLRLKEGQIGAIKGVGGYQLWVLASHQQALMKLRQRKARPTQPFALMVPSVEVARKFCVLSEAEEELLISRASPIVLLKSLKGDLPKGFQEIAEAVAPGNPYLGMMLPSAPLQTLLMDALGVPVVVTSGNRSEEPMAYEDLDALERLSGIADFFLSHNRRIIRPLDDSVVRVVCGKRQVIRLARGLAPLCLEVGPPWGEGEQEQIALGADLKSSIAVRRNQKVLLSETFGSLSTEEGLKNFTGAIENFRTLLNLTSDLKWIRDLHPDYRSSQFAPPGARQVPHHIAHALACAFEHSKEGFQFPVLAVVWDGTGMSEKGELWGGEFLKLTGTTSWERSGHLLPLSLLGGEAAIRDPRKVALALLLQAGLVEECRIFGFSDEEIHNGSRMVQLPRMAPLSSGMGRLFDGVSALLDCFENQYERPQYEAQAAQKLEYRAYLDDAPLGTKYGFSTKESKNGMILDWRPLLKELVQELQDQVPMTRISRKFHNSMAGAIAETCQKIFHAANDLRYRPKIILAGGCFQNQILLQSSCDALQSHGFQVIGSERIPSHDGGIALGQLAYASQKGNI